MNWRSTLTKCSFFLPLSSFSMSYSTFFSSLFPLLSILPCGPSFHSFSLFFFYLNSLYIASVLPSLLILLLSLPSLVLLSEFFERTILCNSLVWSCALTGRAGLTYLEAVESERRAQQNLQNFPSALVVPLLQLVAASSHCRLTELCEDIYCYVKERFFVGETVDIVEHNGTRYRFCKCNSTFSVQRIS